MIIDVDHSGVPNGQLMKECPDMAQVYRNQCVAEQNSVDLSWELFMDPRYKELQNCIAATDEERKRFRQLVVNSVLATDIFATVSATFLSYPGALFEQVTHTYFL